MLSEASWWPHQKSTKKQVKIILYFIQANIASIIISNYQWPIIKEGFLNYFFYTVFKIWLVFYMLLLWLFSHSVVSSSYATPWTAACQAPLSMGFLRQEYWSGLPFLSAGDLPDVGIKLTSLLSLALAGRFFTTEPPGKPKGVLHV